MARIDGFRQAARNGRARQVETRNERRDEEESREEAQEEHDQAMVSAATTRWAFAPVQPRFDVTGATSFSLAPRRASHRGGVHPLAHGHPFSPGWNPLLPAARLIGVADDPHGRSMPIAMNGDTGMLVGLKGHADFILLSIFTRESGRLRDMTSLPRDAFTGSST